MRSMSLEHAVFAAYAAGFVASLLQFSLLHPQAFWQMLEDSERFARAGTGSVRMHASGADAAVSAPAAAADRCA